MYLLEGADNFLHMPQLKALEITYAQHDSILITKRLEDCILEGDVVTVMVF